ncbi:MAG: O-antigen ligase family protein [Oscillochloridaceae bacterium umkhey_bin13]
MASDTFERLRTPVPGLGRVTSINEQIRQGRWYLALWYLAGFGLTVLVALGMLLLGPGPQAIGWAVFVIAVSAIIYNPRYGIYILVGFGLAADGLLNPWFPTMKNFSSAESLLFLSRAFVFNTTEFLIALITASWLVRVIMTRKFDLVLGKLVVPAMVFMALMGAGFLNGVLTGGDFSIALWSSRTIFYYPMMVFLTSQLIRKQAHVMPIFWAAAFGLTFDAIYGFNFVVFTLNWDIHTVLRIAEHSHSIHLNTMFVLFGVLFYFRASPRLRWYLLLVLPFMLISYYGNQRRASYVALGVAIILFALLLQWYNRRIFWTVVPPLAAIFLAYLMIFWDSSGGVAWAAAQVRSVISPVEGSEDESSSIYREIENVNNLFTMRQAPLTGVGFGNKFFIIAPMADISFFEWWEYIVHNSVIWIWMMGGFFGFFSLLFLWGSTIMLGMRNMFTLPYGIMRALAFVAVSYVMMHAVYAYVDMSWDGQSMVYLGVMTGLINIFDRIELTPRPPQRWPWQTELTPAAVRSEP